VSPQREYRNYIERLIAKHRRFADGLEAKLGSDEEPLGDVAMFPLRENIQGESRLERYPGDLTMADRKAVERCPDESIMIEATPWSSNLIVNDASELVAALFKGQANYGGIQYVVVGQGESSWDTSGVPTETVTQTRMVSELGRVAPTITFIDSSNADTLTVTNRISVAGSFGPTQANGSWREWGIVGGTATSTANSGLLIDYYTHSVATKENTETLVRRVRMTF